MTPTHPFCIRPDYTHRDVPNYFDDETGDTLWQPDVYAIAIALARSVGATSLIDIGCGSGRKLIGVEGFDIAGVDFGANLEDARLHVPAGHFIEWDLLDAEGLPFDAELLARSIVICADVIEHLPDPTSLLRFFAHAAAVGSWLVVSTPERELSSGSAHLGPPPNPAHCREWSLEEFTELLRTADVATVNVGLTRSNDTSAALATILCVVRPPSQPDSDRCAVDSILVAPAKKALLELRDSIATHDDALEWNRRHRADLDAEIQRRTTEYATELVRRATEYATELVRRATEYDAELNRRTSELDTVVGTMDATNRALAESLSDHQKAGTAEIQRLQDAITAIHNTRLMRWSRVPRSVLHRLAGRRGR